MQLKNKLNINKGGTNYGEFKIKLILALSLWVYDLHLRRKYIDLTQIYIHNLSICVDMNKQVYQRSMEKYKMDKSAKFNVEK